MTAAEKKEEGFADGRMTSARKKQFDITIIYDAACHQLL